MVCVWPNLEDFPAWGLATAATDAAAYWQRLGSDDL